MKRPNKKYLYLSGPISHPSPEYNIPLFYAAAAELEKTGAIVFNPCQADVDHGVVAADAVYGSKGRTRNDALKRDMIWICDYADEIVMLPGWEKSTGACCERALGIALSLKIKYLRKHKRKSKSSKSKRTTKSVIPDQFAFLRVGDSCD